MPRLIRIDRSTPYKIPPEEFPKDGKSLWICGCGLSRTMPLCDQTHKSCCPNEKPGELHVYDDTRTRVVEVRTDTPAQDRLKATAG